MLYWLEVYILVSMVVLAPFVLLYAIAAAACFGLSAIRFMIRSARNVAGLKTGVSRTHWSLIHR
jgi:hypothetical protein